MFEIKPYPEFSWSLSRHKTLLNCARQYAHQYYSAHNGWLRQAEESQKHAYRLKNITNLEMFFGSLVHDKVEHMINEFYKGNPPADEETLKKEIRSELNSGFLEAVNEREVWWNRPKKGTMFHEIYYGAAPVLPKDKIEKIKQRLELAFAHFFTSKTYREINEFKESVTFMEAEQFRTIRLNGEKVYVVLDFLYHNKETDVWTIVDWKTGKKSAEDPHQLALYVLYILENYPVPDIEHIVIRNEYLLEGTHEEHVLTNEVLEEVQQLMKTSVGRMKSYLEDPSLNKPLPIEQFPQTTEYQRTCTRCNFHELCFPGEILFK
ncbi:PD-(D/E)XK nuclease superfamily protein [Sinobaca qinghaiensis]|uniref:PD-(D/E)XK nuclease superfamily protein n=1 Tax=Sinobaca qinghaiensis TaxID=342944 RepID=A0A419UZK0_9BACL|nr:PD-(D/E)XK nuclease family protein [Sinobaca qinghaiensis]RKD71099.1 PD-(D/E)XK nuclease superfamily protein [Sinobaca qinghaiensis]